MSAPAVDCSDSCCPAEEAPSAASLLNRSVLLTNVLPDRNAPPTRPSGLPARYRRRRPVCAPGPCAGGFSTRWRHAQGGRRHVEPVPDGRGPLTQAILAGTPLFREHREMPLAARTKVHVRRIHPVPHSPMHALAASTSGPPDPSMGSGSGGALLRLRAPGSGSLRMGHRVVRHGIQNSHTTIDGAVTADPAEANPMS